MLKILGRPTSINVRKVLWTCAELGLPYTLEPWGSEGWPLQWPQFIALNPNAMVPVIDDDGFILWESNSICRYLADKYGDGALLPPPSPQRALVEQWMDWQALELNPAWRYAFMALVRRSPQHQDAAQLAAGVDGWNRAMCMLERQLERAGPFITGARLTLADVVRYATDTVRAQLDDKQLRLETQLPATLPTAHADVEKTTWVLINLLANAIRYSPPGEVLLLRAVAWGDMVRVSIHDRGPGIAPEYHRRIFQRFAELPAAAGQRPGSSGLGLSISREFISAQGGRLWVESTVGKGSVFLFTLPLVVVAAGLEADPAD